ncbi:peptide ABC transporter substrate-binding protein [Azorhizobium oxalatiphilum]|uniref:Peptide ABC transporter substrate-binding protein n=1 Tax=Azorhizobium oxalatiphilum TaxID=980631 RepID=A0A917BLN2_9HYPH|nr:ABC transporter substrate-binding protein [Azorhizobium oxalatiphilum]GGF49328.1 peptide ABC transporter substrate-binding protein [Azorhizobium oxalatiphilum]
MAISAIGKSGVLPFGRRLAARLLLAAGLVAAASGAEAAKDRLVVGMPVEPTGLDPTIAAPVSIGQVTWQNVFEGLTRIDRDGKVQPQLAKSWTISSDGLVYRFALQDGVAFHDGTPFDASVAKFALDRARGEKSTNPQKQFVEAITSVEAPDAGTLVVTLKRPSSDLLYRLGMPAAVMVASSSAEANRTTPIGTGPFRFKSWAKGDKVELERNPAYWNKAKSPALVSATFRFLPDPQAQAAALKAGDVDAFPEFSAPELYGAFQKDKNFTTKVGNTELKMVAGMNNAQKPFDDIRVRRALMMAVDRKALVEGAWSGFGTPIGSHYTPNDPGFVDLTGVLPYDPAKAKALLAEAGYGKGLTFTLKMPQMAYLSRSAEVLQAMFADVGVTMNLVPTEFPAKWVQEVFKDKAYDMSIMTHAEPLDLDIYARDNYYFNYNSPKFRDTYNAANAATDPAERTRLIGEAQRILAEEVPALYLFVMPKLGVWSAKLEGMWENEPVPSNDLTDVRWRE